MNEDLLQDRITPRARALLWAAQNCSGEVRDLLGLHPDAAALRGQVPPDGDSLGAILWEELIESEQQFLGSGTRQESAEPASTPASYFLRRRRLVQWQSWRAAADRLPACWLRLLEMPAAEIREVYLGMGLDMIVAAVDGLPQAKVVRWLGLLGSELACRAAADLQQGRSPSPPDAVKEHWRSALAQASRLVAGAKIASRLGRGLLASLFRRLPETERRHASCLSRSSLPSLLERDATLEPATDEELRLAQELLDARLAALPQQEEGH